MDKHTLRVMTSGESIEWYTPRWLYDKYNALYHFTTDPCAESTNHLGCKIFFTKETNGLANIDKWQGNVWINPPYGAVVEEWIKAAVYYVKKTKNVVVMLLPSRTGTKWFHKYIYRKEGVEIDFLPSRLKFASSADYKKPATSARNSAPFDSMVVAFKNCDWHHTLSLGD